MENYFLCNLRHVCAVLPRTSVQVIVMNQRTSTKIYYFETLGKALNPDYTFDVYIHP